MRTAYRMKPPYYGKFRYKLELNLYVDPTTGERKKKELIDYGDVDKYCHKTFGDKQYQLRYSWSTWRPVYLITETDVNTFLSSKYGDYVTYMYKPAPGYENKNLDLKKPGKNALWYGRFPYKIIVHLENVDPDLNEAIQWCEENCFADYRKSGYTGNVSFFFINPLDATAFKLRFSDSVQKTQMPKQSMAKKLLKLRITQAKKDLSAFMEGDTT